MVEDGRAVLASGVRALPVDLGRVMGAEERPEEFFIRCSLGIELDLNGFRVPGAAGADILVRRLAQVVAGVVEGCLHAPEAAAGEGGFLGLWRCHGESAIALFK